jgi:hypothetical protein
LFVVILSAKKEMLRHYHKIGHGPLIYRLLEISIFIHIKIFICINISIKNENIKEIMGVKEKPDIIDIIEKKILQWYGHVKIMPEERISKLILEWVPEERRKRGGPRKTWMEGVQAAMTARNIEQNQWRNREEGCLVCGRRRQLS